MKERPSKLCCSQRARKHPTAQESAQIRQRLLGPPKRSPIQGCWDLMVFRNTQFSCHLLSCTAREYQLYTIPNPTSSDLRNLPQIQVSTPGVLAELEPNGKALLVVQICSMASVHPARSCVHPCSTALLLIALLRACCVATEWCTRPANQLTCRMAVWLTSIFVEWSFPARRSYANMRNVQLCTCNTHTSV